MPDTRPGILFKDGVCVACINFEKNKKIDWDNRFKEFDKLCQKYRGSNGNNYDCAIAISGGKDSHFQTYYMKEVMKMNPVLFTVGNIDWTETGRKNLENLSDAFGCDIIQFNPNRRLARKMFRKAFVEFGSPTWYFDALIYAFPVRMAMKLGVKLLVYGENVSYTYGGYQNEESPSAMLQAKNDVVKPVWKQWFSDGEISEQELESTKQPSVEECKNFGLEPIYLSYYVQWNSVHNYEFAKRWGFQHLGHEYNREGSLENYDQIDSLGYLVHPYIKYPKYGHSIATDYASRWIRYGLKTREEMIPFVEEHDGKLDQGIVDVFCDFIRMPKIEFWQIMDKWYNQELFEKDRDGVWHPKFKVGVGLVR